MLLRRAETSLFYTDLTGFPISIYQITYMLSIDGLIYHHINLSVSRCGHSTLFLALVLVPALNL